MSYKNLLFPIVLLSIQSCKDDCDNKESFTIGQAFGGGIIFYVDASGSHGLIASQTDYTTSAAWGCYGQDIIGANSPDVGSGQENTSDILSECNEQNIAAEICDNLHVNGFNDWYLPSVEELVLMFNLREQIGGFTENNYWSSTEEDANTAWYVFFAGGSKHKYGKDASDLKVRAVRSF